MADEPAAPETRQRRSSKPEALAAGAAMLEKLERDRLAKVGGAVALPTSSTDEQRAAALREKAREEERVRFVEAKRIAEENAQRRYARGDGSQWAFFTFHAWQCGQEGGAAQALR